MVDMKNRFNVEIGVSDHTMGDAVPVVSTALGAKLIEKHFKQYKYPKDYALLMHMSEKHLNRICKTCLNKTASQLILERIVLEAKRMLAFAEFSVSQIADELGYSNSSYFIRLFKKKTGKTPVEFIQKFREGAT